MNERGVRYDLDRDRDTELARADALEPPGKRSSSAALVSSASPIASGIIMRKASGDEIDPEAAASAVRGAEGSSGHALPDELRARFEKSTGMDLGGVRIHTGKQSQDAARAVGAKAYAVGRDIHFAAGEYQPGSRDGQELIAHEVFHTLQAPQPAAGGGMTVSDAHDGAELEADRGAAAMVAGAATAAPAQVAGGVVHRQKKNSYSAQEGLTWEGGTELTEDEMTQWATQKASLAGAAGGYVAWATGFSVNTGAADLVKKLQEAAASDYEKEVETKKQEIAGIEDQVDEWDDKRSSGFGPWKKTDANAEANYQEWKRHLVKAEAELEALEDQQSSREARALRQATSVVGSISSYAGAAAKSAQTVGKELGITMPSAFSSISDATGKIGKIVNALNVGSKMFDTKALKTFQANPSLETATAWANQVGNVFESLSGLAEGLPGGWGTVISSMLAMPGIVTKNFLAVMKKRYDAIDAETREGGKSELLPEGGYSTPEK